MVFCTVDLPNNVTCITKNQRNLDKYDIKYTILMNPSGIEIICFSVYTLEI